MPDPAPPLGLTPRQEAFVREYLVDANGTQAAIRAGYAPGRSAEVQACRLLRDARVLAAIEAGKAKLVETTGFTKQRLIADMNGLLGHAIEAKNYTGAARIAELLAKLHGYTVERRDVRIIRSVADLTDEELAALAAEGERPEAHY